MTYITDAFRKFINVMLDKMVEAGHRTIWAGTKNRQFLVYITFDPDRARKAQKTLGDCCCLCDEELGSFPAMIAIKEQDGS